MEPRHNDSNPLSSRFALMIWNDARTYQILCLGLFLILGVSSRDWTLHLPTVGVTIAVCVFTQGLAVMLSEGRCRSAPVATTSEGSELWRLPRVSQVSSALITALGLSLLLRTDHYSSMVLAGVGAILSKFLLRIADKHIFNPANFGIVIALLLTHDAWVSPGQWGEEQWYGLLFLGTGGIVLKRVGRWDTSVAFLATYAGLEAVCNLWLGWTWDVWLHRLTSGSLLLFALFMITDPRTIPNARIARLIWAGALALLTFVLRNYYFVSTAMFWSLFALSPCTIVLDRLFPAERFTWNSLPQDPELVAEIAPDRQTALPIQPIT